MTSTMPGLQNIVFLQDFWCANNEDAGAQSYPNVPDARTISFFWICVLNDTMSACCMAQGCNIPSSAYLRTAVSINRHIPILRINLF